jgi:hypothetical protein
MLKIAFLFDIFAEFPSVQCKPHLAGIFKSPREIYNLKFDLPPEKTNKKLMKHRRSAYRAASKKSALPIFFKINFLSSQIPECGIKTAFRVESPISA